MADMYLYKNRFNLLSVSIAYQNIWNVFHNMISYLCQAKNQMILIRLYRLSLEIGIFYFFFKLGLQATFDFSTILN